MEQLRQKKDRTIKRQISKGYMLLTGLIIFLVMISMVFLSLMGKSYARVTVLQNQQNEAQQVITAHYKWLEQLSDSITTGSEFKGSLDPATCALGKFLQSDEVQRSDDARINASLNNLVDPHEELHLTASDLIELSKTDRDKAYLRYSEDFKPKVDIIGSGLNDVSDRYQKLSDEITANARKIELVSYILLIAAGVLSAVVSRVVGGKVSKQISDSIVAVTRWSEQLSTGVENLDMDTSKLNSQKNAVEVNRMIKSFQEMADGIRENVRVIKKVAQGELTAYTEIKSEGDSLGKNLYHLVQNNDFMFSNLLRVADSVASSAESIASASQSLAESSSTQATAIETLSSTVEKANDLAVENAEDASRAAGEIQQMMNEVQEGRERMTALLKSVDEIQKASQQISIVLKSINNIAFQTNILALNASVEAARAGAAGKGFAVVADEVRNLALKSSEAAEESRIYIENTIHKADEGGKISKEASETFSTIVESATRISEVMAGIREASDTQQIHMSGIHDEIQKISSLVTDNAASSEETAAATQQMTSDAEVIRKAMHKFQLRKRVPGQAYIPPEKRNDPEFIRIANENYRRAVKEGRAEAVEGL